MVLNSHLKIKRKGEWMTKSNNLLADYAAKKQDICIKNDTISDSLFREYGVNRGLRDVNGKGVLTGLTNISEIVSFKTGEDGSSVPCDGQLWYRGYNVKTLTNNLRPGEFGFEKIAYLLLFGQLPSESELAEFTEVLGRSRTLPTNFTRDVIMKAPSKDIMNSMTRSILTLASYDPLVAKAGIDNNIRQCLSLVAIFPMLAVYGYHAYNHYENDQSMYIHRPDPKLSTAENFLRMLRADNQYTELEARVLDMALILHMEHGGGNNSTFTTRVVTSAGTDTYSAIAAAMSSLKGPKHGGANIKVINMLDNFKANIKHWENEGEVADYIRRTLRKETNDGSGLVYGMGHAVYTISDPRAVILKKKAFELAKGKEIEAEFKLLETIERLTPELFLEVKGSSKTMCANVDMYSGLVYRMLGIPDELFTPLFAVARMAGWAAHRMEELLTGNRLIRPAYKAIAKEHEYVKLEDRK